jgi:DNA primase
MDIKELKERITILEVADKLQITVDKQVKALCPFHDDKSPSLQFSKEKNICTCFSSKCTAGTMDIIGLTEKKLKLNTHEAIMQLKEWIGNVPSNGNGSVKSPTKNESDLSKIALLTKAFRYFENGLRTSKSGKEYLQIRNLIQSTPTQKGIEVGYNAGSFYQRENKYLVESALKYGLVKKANSGHAAFGKGCLVFPLKNKDGQIVGMYFRETDNNKSNHHYYLQNRQGLYPGYLKPETTKLILTESIIDTATLMLVPEITNNYQVLACYGTNGFTEEHTEAIKSLENLVEIILFFDGDKAGKEGIKKNAEIIRKLKPGIKIPHVDTPEGEDINSLSVGHSLHAKAGKKKSSPIYWNPEKK